MKIPDYVAAEIRQAKRTHRFSEAHRAALELYKKFYTEQKSAERAARRHPVHIMHDYSDPRKEANIEECMGVPEYARIHHGEIAASENAVVALLALGYTHEEIAKIIDVGERTVRYRLADAQTHLRSVYSSS